MVVTFHYHRNCGATYCSKTHVQRATEKRMASQTQGDGESGVQRSEHASKRLTRSPTGETIFVWEK